MDFNDYSLIYSNLNEFKETQQEIPFGFYIIIGLCGTAEWKVNLEKYKLEKDAVLFLKKRDFVQKLNTSCDFLACTLYLPLTIIEEAAMRIGHKMIISFTDRPIPFMAANTEITEFFKYTFQLLNFAKKLSVNTRHDIAVLQIRSLLLTICDMVQQKRQKENSPKINFSRTDERFKQFMTLLMEHVRESREVLFYANEMHITPKYLNMLIRRLSGHSPKQAIDLFTINLLKADLKSTEKDIAEIANEYNFPNQSYFGRYFKKMTGMSPSEFRKK